MVSSSLQSSRRSALYRIVGRSGAVVREGVELDSAVVGELSYDAIVTSAESTEAKTAAGVARRRVVRPLGGYVSARVLRPLTDEEAADYRREADAAAERAAAAEARAASPAVLEAARREEARRALVAARRETGKFERKPISAVDAANELRRQQRERGERSAPKKDKSVVSTKPLKGEVNAIKDSIARKGGNSYYFAHNEQNGAEKTTVLLEPRRIDDVPVVEEVAPGAGVDGGGAAEAPSSELGASIAKHGENSYYYAHSAAGGGVRVDNAPVKLETSARKEVPITEVREFGFSEEDGGAKICVYVPAPGIGDATDDDVTLLWDDTTVVLRFWHDGHKRQLDLPGRKGPFIRTRGRMDCVVKKCKVKKKKDKLVLFVYLDLDPGSGSDTE